MHSRGGQEDGKYVLNNHLRFTILYHRDPETELARIVGFEVGAHNPCPLLPSPPVPGG